MSTAADLLLRKERGRFTASLPSTATVLDAARLMNEHRIGSIVVIDDDRLEGIFTERDVLQRVVVAGLDPGVTKIGSVMSAPVACGTGSTSLVELRAVMRENRIRHIPIVDDQKLLGIVSIGDLNEADLSTQTETIRYLEQYLTVR